MTSPSPGRTTNVFHTICVFLVIFGLGNLAVDVYDTYVYRNVVIQDGMTAQQIDEHLDNH